MERRITLEQLVTSYQEGEPEEISQQRTTSLEKSFSFLKRIALEKVPDYVFDEKLFKRLFDYFLRPQKKGLMIIGNIGSGKSSLMRIFSQWATDSDLKLKFGIHSVRKIESDYKTYGHESIAKYSYSPEKYNLCLDDIGLESAICRNYGNEINVFSELVLDRYDILRYGYLTHGTTNLDIKSLKSRYDPRVVSRMSEMFEIVALTGKDRRK